MSCSICSRAPHPHLPFHCPTCARNQLYQLRVEGTRVLLEKEVLGKRIETAVAQGHGQEERSNQQQPLLRDDSSPRWALRVTNSHLAESLARREYLALQLQSLRAESLAKKAEICQRKETLARRRSDAESARYQLGEREDGALASVQNTSKRAEHVWHNLHNKTAESRIYLCREVANLYGLRKAIKKGQDRDSYVLGGDHIVDLTDMNGISQEQISTSLSNIAHLVMIVSHYLSLRLPAEITLPHRNYPVATIYTPSASYRSRNSHPRLDHQFSSSPAASRTMDPRVHTPRPRPLSIGKPLPKLAKEEFATYTLFLEGATLLAWNVAWLCRTQGISISSDSWEEVCDIGKNLWQLLVAPPAHPSTLMRAFAGRDTQAQAKPGVDFMRMWKLPTPTKIADKLKSNLLGEMASAEWELLEEKEWGDAVTESHQSISQSPQSSIQGPPLGSHTVSADSAKGSPSSRTRTNSVKKSEASASDPRPKGKGTKGWTKVGSR